jgi:hypothetical protein
LLEEEDEEEEEEESAPATPLEVLDKVASSIETNVTESLCRTKGPKLSWDTVRFQVPTHEKSGFFETADILHQFFQFNLELLKIRFDASSRRDSLRLHPSLS